MLNRSSQTCGSPQWGTVSRRARPRLVVLPALLVFAPNVVADSQLQTQAFGNLHDSRLTRYFPLLDTLRPVNRTSYHVSFSSVRFEVYRPDAALNHRNKVQGMTFLDDKRVVLSTSFGPRRGALAFQRLAAPPLGDAAHGLPVTLPDDLTLHVQALNRSTREFVMSTPAGAEGISSDSERIAVAFKGGRHAPP